jgi:phosphoglycerol transferase MdoB-like AlkP superfamily enzyme
MDENRTRLEQPQQDAPKKRSLWPLFFFPMALLYHELLLHAFDRTILFWDTPLVYILLFSAAGGFLLSALVDILPRRAAHIVTYALCVFWTVLTCIEYCCKSYFKSYWGLSFITQMTGNVVGNFFSTMLEIIFGRIVFILLSFLPLVLLIILRRRLLPGKTLSVRCRVMALAVFAVCQAVGSALCYTGEDRADYTYNYVTDYAVPRFGLAATIRLEAQYAIFGLPDAPVIQVDEPVPDEPVVYDYNKMELDFTATSDLVGGSTLENMHNYFSSKTASQQNEYTGMFKGKNLIQITAEAFSPYVISKELTPTLYKLTHEGFVFTNYYQPGWGQSTTGGEFAHMTGIIPTWVNGNLSFYASHQDYMPFALGNQFRALGYTTVAYHNNSYTYYNRHLTHPNLGYDYYGQGNGLTLTVPGWPYSDLEMMELTAPAYIEDYVNTGKPFHAYYMSVSGHANWGWGNAMSAKNREAAVAAYPNASQPVQGYIAANLELEYALTYLLEQLEAAGIADDTVICMTADHYPYALVTDEVDYYQELSGKQDSELDISRYKNTWLLWSGSMESSVTVRTPCSAIDILPTVSNLFGLEFDSRLMSGHDVFAQNYNASQASTCMPLVILPTNRGYSWITAAGTYDAKTRTFTPNPGITVADDYVKTVSSLIDAKYSYARQLIQYDYAGVVLHHPQATHVMAAPPKPPEPSTDETADDTVNEGYVDDTGTGDTTE